MVFREGASVLELQYWVRSQRRVQQEYFPGAFLSNKGETKWEPTYGRYLKSVIFTA